MDYLKEGALTKHGWDLPWNRLLKRLRPQGPARIRQPAGPLWEGSGFPGLRSAGLLTCHIDTKTGIPDFTGANDGASAAAAILETARILSRDPARAGQLELVFFDGEESFSQHIDSDDGLYGSRILCGLSADDRCRSGW